jgi:hypothetical protein
MQKFASGHPKGRLNLNLYFRKTLCLFTLAYLSGCASYTAPVDRQKQATAGKSYLYGRFQKSRLPNIGLVIENIARTREYVFQFKTNDEISVIEVEPDTYEITRFVAASFNNEIIGHKLLRNWPYRTPFIVRPNTVYYLKDFTGSTYRDGFSFIWEIKQPTDRYNSATSEFLTGYPSLGTLERERALSEFPGLQQTNQPPLLEGVRSAQ